MSFYDRRYFGGEENYISDKFEEMVKAAREQRCKDLGIDMETLDIL